MDTRLPKKMSQQQLHDRSAEYADNRLSLFCAQFGKCAVTGKAFEVLENIHCHHKIPKSKGGKDNYQNLVLVHEDVHRLIHAATDTTIQNYLSLLDLNKKQVAKLNKLRKQAETPLITV